MSSRAAPDAASLVAVLTSDDPAEALRSARGGASADFTRAILNILDDFASEKDRLGDSQRAVLNILEDFAVEKERLESTQKAVLNILEDFDEEKQKVEAANRDLMQRTQQLGISNAELEQFAYVASHDLQEPLRMVSNYVQLLERRYKGHIDDQADKYIRYAVEGAGRMQALIGGLLEYSRIGQGELPSVNAFDTNAAFLEAKANIASATEESGAVIVHEELPMAFGDPQQIAQVFQNLLGNALKFRRAGVAPRVEVRAERANNDVEFTVADNGIGIEPQYASRIFVIFQRLHTRAEYPGTGIGLSICKKMIERNGGRIWVDSVPGAGATFHFTLRAATS
jgi:light-regulated signal transduction histidine kinase (bacteriophytochrome)